MNVKCAPTILHPWFLPVATSGLLGWLTIRLFFFSMYVLFFFLIHGFVSGGIFEN